MKFAAALVSASLAACSGPMVQTSAPATHIRWVVAPVEVFQALPGCEDIFIMACAVRFTSGYCVILAPLPEDQTPRFVRDHEYEHCAGKDHI